MCCCRRRREYLETFDTQRGVAYTFVARRAHISSKLLIYLDYVLYHPDIREGSSWNGVVLKQWMTVIKRSVQIEQNLKFCDYILCNNMLLGHNNE